MTFFFGFDSDRQSGRDMVLLLGDERFASDSFAFMVDWLHDPAQNDPDKIRKVIVMLLEQWAAAVSVAGEGETIFLPFAFEERDTGCLRCVIGSNAQVELDVGVSSVPGMTVSPSLVGDFIRHAPAYRRVSRSILRVTREELLTRIAESVTTVRAGRW